MVRMRMRTVAGGWSAISGAPFDSVIGRPAGIAVGGNGTVYFTDYDRACVMRIGTDGTLDRVAGVPNEEGYNGDGQPAIDAWLSSPYGIAVRDEVLYVADSGNDRIRAIFPDGTIHTLAGSGEPGFSGDHGPASAAELLSPCGVAVSSTGVVYLADTDNSAIRRVDAGGVITTVAGTGISDYAGDDGPAAEAMLNRPFAITVDSTDRIYVADWGNNRVRAFRPGENITTVAGCGTRGYAGDGGDALLAELNSPIGLAVGGGASLLIADAGNHRIRRLTEHQTVDTIAGTGVPGRGTDEGPAHSAELHSPAGLAHIGFYLYLADSGNRRVLCIERVP